MRVAWCQPDTATLSCPARAVVRQASPPHPTCPFPPQLPPYIDQVLYTVCLVWANSGHYSTPSRIIVILQEICNLFIELVCPGRRLLCHGQPGGPRYVQRRAAAALSFSLLFAARGGTNQGTFPLQTQWPRALGSRHSGGCVRGARASLAGAVRGGLAPEHTATFRPVQTRNFLSPEEVMKGLQGEIEEILGGIRLSITVIEKLYRTYDACCSDAMPAFFQARCSGGTGRWTPSLSHAFPP